MKKISFSLIVQILIPLLVHLILIGINYSTAGRVKYGVDIQVTSIEKKMADDPQIMPIEILCTYGDIFEPKISKIDRAYDMIIISATIDPLKEVDEKLELSSNLLLRDFLEYTISTHDKTLLDSAVKHTLEDMTTPNNTLFINFFSQNDVCNTISSFQYLAKLCEPLIAPIPESSTLRKKGIKYYAVLPLFDSEIIRNKQERDEKLKICVRAGISRILWIINQNNNLGVRFYGIPAIAGTETRQDSCNYLTYKDSYLSIINGIRGSILPSSCERFYLIAWNKLERRGNKEESIAQVNAMKYLYNYFKFKRTDSKVLSFLLLFVLILGFRYGVRKMKLIDVIKGKWWAIAILIFTEMAGLTVINNIANVLTFVYENTSLLIFFIFELIFSVFIFVVGLAFSHNPKTEGTNQVSLRQGS